MPRIIKSAQGTFTTSTITVDADGRVISAESGTAGGGMFTPKVVDAGPASGTFTTNGSFVGAYLYAGGGGGGGGAHAHNGRPGGSGGKGGFGYYGAPVSAPFSQPYTIGGGGSGGSGNPHTGSAGSAGGATSLATIGTVTGGGGGNGGAPANGSPGTTGTTGAAPGATLTPPSSVRTLISGADFGTGGNPGTGGHHGGSPAGAGTSGSGGCAVIFDNTGT
tara:strand:+ start:184 stop:843 length:660 start_codon:yes stop_codon:yes gene_type:complete